MTVNFQKRQTTSTPEAPVTLTINCSNGCPLQTDVSYFGRAERGVGRSASFEQLLYKCNDYVAVSESNVIGSCTHAMGVL